jgi:hypothetical protein
MTVKRTTIFSVFSVKEKLITSGTRTGDEMRKTKENQKGVKEREVFVIFTGWLIYLEPLLACYGNM